MNVPQNIKDYIKSYEIPEGHIFTSDILDNIFKTLDQDIPTLFQPNNNDNISRISTFSTLYINVINEIINTKIEEIGFDISSKFSNITSDGIDKNEIDFNTNNPDIEIIEYLNKKNINIQYEIDKAISQKLPIINEKFIEIIKIIFNNDQLDDETNLMMLFRNLAFKSFFKNVHAFIQEYLEADKTVSSGGSYKVNYQ